MQRNLDIFNQKDKDTGEQEHQSNMVDVDVRNGFKFQLTDEFLAKVETIHILPTVESFRIAISFHAEFNHFIKETALFDFFQIIVLAVVELSDLFLWEFAIMSAERIFSSD